MGLLARWESACFCAGVLLGSRLAMPTCAPVGTPTLRQTCAFWLGALQAEPSATSAAKGWGT